MVLVADHVAECRLQDHRADHPLGIALGGDVEDADPRKSLALDGDERVPEQLVHAADHQHRRAVSRQGAQDVGVVNQVVLDPRLPTVLAATAEHEVRVRREVVARVVLMDRGFVTVPTQSAGQATRVAEVSVDAHLAWVDVNDLDPALAGGVVADGVTAGCAAGAHAGSSPNFARPYLAARSRRSVIIAVYVQKIRFGSSLYVVRKRSSATSRSGSTSATATSSYFSRSAMS